MENSWFISDIPDAIHDFPGLSIVKEIDGQILRGYIELFSKNGDILDTFNLDIHPSFNYPYAYPIVYETGGRIPHNIDWHVYPEGNWCIGAPAEELLACKNGIKLKDFISVNVQGFLYNQIFRAKNGYFYRERSHGVRGSLEYYKEYLNLSQFSQVELALKAVVESEPKPDSKCFCGSNRKFHKCHRRQIRELKKYARNTIAQHYNVAQSYNLFKK